jgi:NitT/TauT family transport system substrate-binding protein
MKRASILARRMAQLTSAFLVVAGIAPAQADTIKIGIVKVTGLGAAFVAQEMNYFREEGLDAEFVYFDAAQPVAVAAVSGAVDFGVSAVTGGFYNLAAQGALKIIAPAAHEFPGFHGQSIIAARHAYEAGLKSVKDIAGHSLVVTGSGGPPVYVVGGLLANKYAFDFRQIKLVPLQTIPNIVSSIAGGQTDFTLISLTSALVPLVQRGDVKLLGWVGDETPWQFAVVFAPTALANGKRDLVEHFLRAYRKGARDIHDAFTGPDERRADQPTANVILSILAKYTDQTPEEAKLSVPYFDRDGRLDENDILHQVSWYKSQGAVKGDVDGAAMIDMRYVIPMPDP